MPASRAASPASASAAPPAVPVANHPRTGHPVHGLPQPGRVRVQVDLGRGWVHVPENVLRLIEGAARLQQVRPACVPEHVRRDMPARADAVVIRSPTAPGRIGAQAGSRNKLTSAKSLPAAWGTPNRSSS
jgi:hypothetical protein